VIEWHEEFTERVLKEDSSAVALECTTENINEEVEAFDAGLQEMIISACV
jgi:hypothetical protein